jgi:hypothetical protein
MPQEFFRLARLATMLAGFTVLAACGGGGGGGSGLGGGGNPNPPGGGAQVTVSGKITFDRLVFSTTPTGGLNPNAPVESPAREITVQAMSGALVLATATTDANGDYSFSVPASTTMFIRAQARMEKTGTAPTWSFTVRDNTNSDAMYVLDGASFDSGTAAVTRNLKAPSDWNGNGYNPGRRAAPFAILDTVYRTKQLILGASPTAPFPALNLYWSEDNKNADPFCPDNGSIGTSFYFRDSSNQTTDSCAPTTHVLPEGIYILGDYSIGDTDEYDSHVIAHEFGHYFEDRFSRSDSIGGDHSSGDRLDLRVAFGEGWGNAFGAMALNDPQYRDSSGGISQDFGFNLETNSNVNAGWFSEASVGEFLWDVFDSVDDSGDSVSLGFTPIYTVMTGPQVQTNAMTSIFTFATALRAQNSGISTILGRENINGTDDYGTNETADGGVVGTLPVYKTISLGGAGQAYVCSVATAGAEGNKLGNRQFLRFTNDVARTVQIRAQGATNNAQQAAATDPDIYVHRRGALVVAGEGTDAGVETVNTGLAANTEYIIEVLDFDATGTTPRCMNVSITG